MSSALHWVAGLSMALVVSASVVGGCSSKKSGLDGDDSSNSGGSGGGSDTTSSSGFSGNSGGSSGFSSGSTVTNNNGGGDTGPCKGGHYGGTFAGSYTSHLTGVGIPIPVVGDVNLELNQEGTAGQQCTVHGEFAQCSDVFSLQNGVIQGTADGLFPYFCTMTGTLDCKDKVLDDGWIQCTYCIGPLADGGLACTLGNGVGGTTGIGGHFAGPLTANYDYGTLSFINGAWNGAEALAGNDGGSPGPEGGSLYNYLSDGGLYLGPNDFGGIGTWNATSGKDAGGP
jgi:hypothetical protein